MWFRKTHLMSKKPCEFFVSLFSLNQEVAFCQESMELQPEKSQLCLGFWNPRSWWELMREDEDTDSVIMNVTISNILPIHSNNLNISVFFSLYREKTHLKFLKILWKT